MEALILFFSMSLVVCFTPGPTVLLILSRMTSNGSASVAPITIGILLGDLVLITMSIYTLSFFAEELPQLLNSLRVAGAFYLIYLGSKEWRLAKSKNDDCALKPQTENFSTFAGGFLVTFLNPKSLLFYFITFPAFINFEDAYSLQLAILGGAFLLASAFSIIFYSYLGLKIVSGLSRGYLKKLRQASGAILISLGCYLILYSDVHLNLLFSLM